MSLMTESASIRYEPDKVGPRDLMEHISDMGYEVALKGAGRKGGAAQTDEMRARKQRETRAWLVRFLIALAFSLPLFIIAMILPYALSEESNPFMTPLYNSFNVEMLVSFLLATPVQVGPGLVFYKGAYHALRRKTTNMDTLVVMGTTAAYIYSIVVMVRALVNPHLMDTMTFFDAGAMIVTFITLGKYLEHVSKSRTSEVCLCVCARVLALHATVYLLACVCFEWPARYWRLHVECVGPAARRLDLTCARMHAAHSYYGTRMLTHAHTIHRDVFPLRQALRKLMELQASSAILVVTDANGEVKEEKEIPIELVQVGDTLKVLPGSKVPTDGVVLSGDSAVDESMVTGESMPVRKSAGDNVIGGSINSFGALRMRATKVGGDTVLNQIFKLVENAQASKAPIQAMADKVKRVSFCLILTLVASPRMYAVAQQESSRRVPSVEWPHAHTSLML